jgi:Tfp pilus assembly protein PilX
VLTASLDKEIIMLRVFVCCILSFYAISANAADSSCTIQAAEKKLAGAAKTSFMNKCEHDARTSCETTAGEKKLAGAAKTSFTNKCVKDAVGG